MSKLVNEFLNNVVPYPCGPRVLELRSELENHLLECMEEHLEQGVSEQEAFQAAVQTLGSIRLLKRHIQQVHRGGRSRRSLQLLLGFSLLIVYPLILFLFSQEASYPFAMLIPVLIGAGILANVGYGHYMDIVMNRYEPLKDAGSLLGIRVKHKE